MNAPEKLEVTSMDLTEEQRTKLGELFPEVLIEGKTIDFDRLKLTLGAAIDVGKERYGMNWPGKAECFRTIQAPSLGTLLPCPEESVNFDSSENLLIEGDNLEVLKLLQKSYLNKIKVIYIDPPYNTGHDFIYPDNYSETLETYLRYTGQIDLEGRKFSTTPETDGRFHSKWLNMMYPRLFLARNLLADDGLIFISIDDKEVDNLVKICDEIFGEDNFVELVAWKNKYGAGAKTKGFITLHEYIVCYSKSDISNIEAPLSSEEIKSYNKKDAKFATRGGYVTQPLATTSLDERPNLRYAINHNGKEIWPEKQWVWAEERTLRAQANDEIVVAEKNGKFSVRFKQYLRNEQGVIRKGKPLSLLNGPFTQEGTEEIQQLFGSAIFDFPKPSALIKYLLSFTVNEKEDKEAIVLDFFAGSGTTGHAVLELNKEDTGNRKFILVQLPAPTERTDFLTISEITKERVRRVIDKLNNEEAVKLRLEGTNEQDRGFRLFKLAESNFKPWDAVASKSTEELTTQLALHVDHLREGREADDLLYEILLKSGFSLSTPVESLKLEGEGIYSVADGALLICLSRKLTLELIRGIARLKPERVVCLDEGFSGNDQLKANAVQIFKTKGITSFKTI